MITKNGFKFLAAALMLLGTSVVAFGHIREDKFPAITPKLTGQVPIKAPSVTHDYDWYAAKTYDWTDANGTTHTASLVDEVTNPYQMYDMLKWVYCSPEIPGNTTTAVTNSNVYYGEQYYVIDRDFDLWNWEYVYTHQDPGWGITDDNVTAPYDDGHTLFLVKLKNYGSVPDSDMYTQSKADLIDYFSRYIESIKLITDYLRGGTGDNQGTMVNIEGEFNRFFIIGKGKSYYWEPDYYGEYEEHLPPFAPFYNMFEEYSPTTTDSGAEITDFYETMNNGETYPVIHDCGSVILFEHYFSMAGKNGTEEKSMTGMIFFIPDNRNARNKRDYSSDHRPYVGMYVIELDAEAAPAAQEATYDVTLDWTSTLDEVAKSVVPQTYTVYIVVTDEYGNQSYELLTTTTETTYTYQVPQNEHSYTISYIVHGFATQNNAFEAWSNIDDVVIPGTNDFLSLKLNHYESDYVSSEEMNYYRNFLNIENEDAVNALTPERVANGESSFILYRYELSNPDVLIPVAQLDFENATGANRVNYTITYDNQEPLEGYNVPITTNGSLNVGAGNAINLAPITFVDQFNAFTGENLHPSRYGYVLTQNEVDNPKSTNTVEVPVLKTESSINGFYTYEEVMADTDAILQVGVKNAEVEMSLVNNPAIYYYTLERGDNTNPNDGLSKLQRRTDGTFMEMNNRLGMAGNLYEEGPLNIFDNDVLTGSYNDFATYVPVIWTFGSNRVKQDGENSYGSPIWKTGVADVYLGVEGVKTTGEGGQWKDENGKTCCIYYPTIKADGIMPENTNVMYDPFMFRVWRLCDEVRGYYFDSQTGNPVNDVTVDRSPMALIYEEISDATSIELGGVYSEYGFGARINADIKFLVRFYYQKVDLSKNDGTPLYYVVEKLVPWNEIPTGIIEINAANEVSKTYINAQGMKSDKPFDGINIVITRYSDGSTKTTKVVR